MSPLSTKQALGGFSLVTGALLCFLYNPLNLWYISEDGFKPALISAEDAWGVSLKLSTENYEAPNSLANGYYPWRLVAEPHRNTRMEVSSLKSVSPDASGSSSTYFSWIITKKGKASSANDAVVTHSSQHTHMFTSVGMHTVRIDEVDSVTKNLIHTFSTDVMCKYVRREMRSLTSDDRETFLKALRVIYSTTDLASGQKLYGPRFRTGETFTKKHLWEMTLEGCTPFHDGPVFFTAHAAFDMEMEQALQSIDASIALPYWDYTIDHKKYGIDWMTESPMWGDEWFGSLSTTNEDRIVDSGRFAYTPVQQDSSAPEHNSFGMVTEVHNNDPVTFVTRGNEVCGYKAKGPLPGCTELKGALVGADTMHELQAAVEYDFHAILHSQIGGVWDCGADVGETLAENPAMQPGFEMVAVAAGLLYRRTFENGYLVCPDSCDAATQSFQDCQCSCPDYDTISLDDDQIYNTLAGSDTFMLFEKFFPVHFENAMEFDYSYSYEYDDDADDSEKAADASTGGSSGSGTASSSDGNGDATASSSASSSSGSGRYVFKGVSKGDDREMKRLLLKLMCHPGKEAPFSTTLAAANDPVFWPTHSLYERIWASIRIARGPGGSNDFNSTWVAVGGCSYSNGYDDRLPFRSFFDDTSEDWFYTNRMLDRLFDPANEELPYIFDDLSWSECDWEV